MAKLLEEKDFIVASKLLRCEIAAIKAVAEVEAPKGGFNPDDTPVTLFEGHWFSRYTKGMYDSDYPTISYSKWTKKFYGKTWEEEKERLAIAISLDKHAALLSASWGKFQIMGFNHAICGFSSVEKFVDAMYENEGYQLIAFCNYVIRNGLSDELREHRWADFAYRYNGTEWQKNKYAERLEKAYIKYS